MCHPPEGRAARASVPPISDSAVRPLKVTLYTGVVFERDAVSRSFLWKLELMQRLRAGGFPIEVAGFAQASDAEDVDLRVIGDITGLLRDPFFNRADLHIFEYGMCYDLFNVLMLLDRPSLVIDHNTTPPALITDPVVKRACAKAEVERHNLFSASHVATDSEFSRNALLELGMDPDGVTVLHLPPTNSFVGRSEHTFTSTKHGDEVRLTYVGRPAKAKGLQELLCGLEVILGYRRTNISISRSPEASGSLTTKWSMASMMRPPCMGKRNN